MNPYDFPVDTKKVVGSESDFYKFIDQNYFNVCRDSRVLEIGPCQGKYSKLIVQHNPKYFEVIEPDSGCTNKLKEITGINNIIVDDAWLVLNKTNLFDVVICFGVLYHHHSPMHLLELIANYTKPKYIMLDCVQAPHPLAYELEAPNAPGNRQIGEHWKHVGYNFNTPFFIINSALANMDYQLVQTHKLNFDYFPKSNSWVALWQLKKEEEE